MSKAYQHILNGTELELAPAGWDKLGINFIRNEFYWGISRNLLLSLRFPLKAGGGGLDIEAAYEAEGINAVITYVLKERNPQTDDYDIMFSGILDFTPGRWNIDKKEKFFEIGAIDGSKEQKYFTRDDVQFDLNSLISADGDPLTDHNGSTPVNFGTVNIYLEAALAGTFSDNFSLNNSTKQEFLDPNLSTTSNQIGDRVDTENPFYTNTTSFEQIVTVNLGGSYNITYSNNQDTYQMSTVMRLLVTSYNDGGVQLEQRVYASETLKESGSPYIRGFSDSQVFAVPAGGYIETKLWFYRGTSPFPYNPSNAISALLTFSSFGIFEKSPGAPTSAVDCFYIEHALARIIQIATGENTEANILDASAVAYFDEILAMTTGWNLRGYPDKPFNISGREIFQTGDAMTYLGFYYDRGNDVFKVVHKQELFKGAYEMLDLGEVSGLKITPSQNDYFNEVDFGWGEEVEYEELQGANEFNTPSKHFLKMPVKKKKDVKTAIHGDTVGAELSRRLSFETYAQQDSRYDEQRFIFESLAGTIRQGTDVTGGFQGSDEYYNTRHTPRQMLKRWAGYLNVPLWKETIKSTQFVKTQKNTEVEVLSQSELTGLTASDLTRDPIYHPEIYELKAPLSKSQLEVLNVDPHGLVRFTYRGEDFGGFLLEVKSNGFQRDAVYKLIKAPAIDKTYLFESGESYTFEDGTDYNFE